MRKRIKHYKLILALMLILLSLGMTIGYSILGSDIKMTTTTNISSKFDVYIESIRESSSYNAETTSGPTITGRNTANVGVKLLAKNASVTYQITVRNSSTFPVQLNEGESSIPFSAAPDIDGIVVTVSGLYQDDYPIVMPGEALTFNYEIYHDPSQDFSHSTVSARNFSITLVFDQCDYDEGGAEG